MQHFFLYVDQNKFPIFKLCNKKKIIKVHLFTEMIFQFKMVK